MPSKPTRRDRRRTGPATPQRQPGALPASSPPAADDTAADGVAAEPEASTSASSPIRISRATARPGRPPVARPGTRPATGEGGTLAPSMIRSRRPGTSAARSSEVQREARVRRDAMHDLKVTGITAGVTFLALVATVLVLQ